MSRTLVAESLHGPHLGSDWPSTGLSRWRDWRPGLWSLAAAGLAVSVAAAFLAARTWPA